MEASVLTPVAGQTYYVIASDPFGAWWTDDLGGSLFRTVEGAERCIERNHLTGVKVLPCPLDPDLMQHERLYFGD